MSKSNETLLQNRLQDAMYELYDVDEFFEDIGATTFKQAGLMTNDAGIVLTFPDGSEFQLTIKQTKEANT